MSDDERPGSGPAASATGRFARARILIVGCGDVGLRVAARLAHRYRILATTRSDERGDAFRSVGIVPLVVDLDRSATLDRLGGLAPTVIHLAPPPPRGTIDSRTRALLRSLHGVERMVYVSTSGVYGDCGGAWVDETRAPAPSTDRARRRVDAEACLRAWARGRRVHLSILRVPGIYAADRLPVARIRASTPALRPADDVYTNHIHAEDLARLIVLALARSGAQRIYHAVDDSALRMGDWFDAVADAYRLPRPERVTRDAIAARVSPELLSFMTESRRLTNRRMHAELGMRLDYRTVHDGLAAAMERDPSIDATR